MKKKFLAVLLAFVTALCLCLGLSACGEGDNGGNGGNGGSVEDGGNNVQEGENNKPSDACEHVFTAQNVCEKCGEEWEFTEGLEYELDEGTDTYRVVNIHKAKGDVVVPYGYQGKFVTAVYGWTEEELEEIENVSQFMTYDLTNIIFSDSVVEIGDYAFAGCAGLVNVTIGSGVTSIGMRAFWNCSRLKNIEISDNVIYIGGMAFDETDYYNNQNHWDSDGVLYIGNHLIKAKQSITGAYTIRAGTKTIAGIAFSELGTPHSEPCRNLTSIVIPDSVVSIGEFAFGNCTGLKEVTIGSGVKSIATYDFDDGIPMSFYGCDGLEHIIVSDKNTVYKSEGECLIEIQTNKLILGCYNSIVPEDVTSIDIFALYLCKGLTNITIPDNVTSIGGCAFGFCGGLESVTVGSGVTSIGMQAFMECKRLTDIQFKGTVEEWKAIEKGEAWDYDTGNYIITCTDGTVDKDGSVMYFDN